MWSFRLFQSQIYPGALREKAIKDWFKCGAESSNNSETHLKILYERAKVMDAGERNESWREHLRFVGLLRQLSCFGLQPQLAAEKQIKGAVNISSCVGFLLHSVHSSAQRKGFQISGTLLEMLFIFPNRPLIHVLWLLRSGIAGQCAVVCQAQGYSHPTAHPLLYRVFYLERDII